MEEAKASVMIANSPHSLFRAEQCTNVIGQDGKGSYVMEKDETAKEIVKRLEVVLCNHVTAFNFKYLDKSESA